MIYSIISSSASETENAGKTLAGLVLENGWRFVALDGDIGAGKTVFVRGMVSVLSPGSRVKSPTYTIVNEYIRGSVPVYHFDFYRISSSDELESIGFDEYLSDGICIAEWSSVTPDVLPDDAVRVRIEKTGDTTRSVCVTASEECQ